jgi:predicted TIM-barrel fold metal-dependent hydrolase
MIALFDSLVHPVGEEQKELQVSFLKIKREMKAAGFTQACAVRMNANRNPTQEKVFVDLSRQLKVFSPIALIDPHANVTPAREIKRLKDLGFVGVKFHPRTTKHNWSHPALPEYLMEAGRQELVVMLCTYSHFALCELDPSDHLNSLKTLLKTAVETRIMLMHGGDIRLLEYSELVRANPNLLLDLSFTVLKYAGSSLDMDLRFLFSQFDRRICIGTDYPEFSHNATRCRFEIFARGLAADKKKNIGHNNLKSFFAL